MALLVTFMVYSSSSWLGTLASVMTSRSLRWHYGQSWPPLCSCLMIWGTSALAPRSFFRTQISSPSARTRWASKDNALSRWVRGDRALSLSGITAVWSISHYLNNLFDRWTVSRCGRGLCPRSGWPSLCWTLRRSAVLGGFSSERLLAGRSVNPSVTSHRSSLSTRNWVFRRHTPNWLYPSTPQAPLYWLSLPPATMLGLSCKCTLSAFTWLSAVKICWYFCNKDWSLHYWQEHLISACSYITLASWICCITGKILSTYCELTRVCRNESFNRKIS